MAARKRAAKRGTPAPAPQALGSNNPPGLTANAPETAGEDRPHPFTGRSSYDHVTIADLVSIGLVDAADWAATHIHIP